MFQSQGEAIKAASLDSADGGRNAAGRVKAFIANRQAASDRRLRFTLGPPLGWVICSAAGLLGDSTWREPRFWLGMVYFGSASVLLWTGNVYIWFWLRGRPDWIVNAGRRLRLIAGAVLTFTVPSGVLMFSFWYLLSPPHLVDWAAVTRATLWATLASGLIFHIYETIDLITQRARERAATRQLEYARALAELSALKAQIDPHFMFNCLNTLAGLIETSPDRALRFTIDLGAVYRYILQSRSRELVTLHEELAFLAKYHALLQLRFEDGIQLQLPVPAGESWLPAVSLQLLLENAVKHNEFSAQSPLCVVVEMSEDTVTLRHVPRRGKPKAASEGVGLRNLDERCRLLLERGIVIRDEPEEFAVTVPLKLAE
ncbi:MAG: histidine kinase [Bryobacteraceae bacterium]|nr:histidine kinase [Bryobacteraceae bacterium]